MFAGPRPWIRGSETIDAASCAQHHDQDTSLISVRLSIISPPPTAKLTAPQLHSYGSTHPAYGFLAAAVASVDEQHTAATSTLSVTAGGTTRTIQRHAELRYKVHTTRVLVFVHHTVQLSAAATHMHCRSLSEDHTSICCKLLQRDAQQVLVFHQVL